jgi:Cdc6-like AAA superfamily ATPase
VLARVRDGEVLRATLSFEALEAVHYPFDDLLGNSATEAALARAAAASSTVLLLGSTGTGKSSILAYELGQLSERAPETLVPLRVPMDVAEPNEVSEFADFARHIVRHVTGTAAAERFTRRQQEELADQTADLERRTGRRRRVGARLTAPLVVTQPGLAVELGGAGSEIERRIGSGEVLQALNDLLGIVRGQGVEPYLVFDDTDVWLRSSWHERSEELVTGFFGRNVRTLVREVGCGFALAAHHEYLEHPGFRQSSG